MVETKEIDRNNGFVINTSCGVWVTRSNSSQRVTRVVALVGLVWLPGFQVARHDYTKKSCCQRLGQTN